MKKYLIKVLASLCVITLSLGIMAGITLNIVLLKLKGTIARAIEAQTAQKVSVGSIMYLPPFFILVREIALSEMAPRNPGMGGYLVIPKVLIRFSLREFLWNRQFVAKSISVRKPTIEYHTAFRLVKENFTQILDFIRQFPLQDMALVIKEARLTMEEQKYFSRYFAANLTLRLKGNVISGVGSLSENTDYFQQGHDTQRRINSVHGIPLDYNFNGAYADDSFFLEKIEVKRQNLHAQLWGDVQWPVVRMNGFAFVNTDAWQAAMPFGFKEKKGLWPRPRALSSKIDLSLVNLYLLDIHCQFNFAFPRLHIERLSFLLNNNPVSIKGTLTFADRVLLNLGVSLGPAKLEKPVIENLKKIDLSVIGALKDKVLTGNGILSFDFIKKEKANPPLERFKAIFKDLAVDYAVPLRMAITLGKLDLFCVTESNTYRMLLEGLKAKLHLRHKKLKYVEFDGRFYDGLIKGQGAIDIHQPFPNIRASMKLKGVTANKLEGLLVHFSKVFGKIDGRFFFRTYPFLGLKGAMDIHNGYMENFEFFKWLADFFELSALRKIAFSEATANFFVNSDGAGLSRMRLDSPEVGLRGYFTLGLNDMVTSRISLALTRDLLAGSPKFIRLLRLVESGLDTLVFKFQLSGILHRMNFKWSKSDLKKFLQDSIPNFIERAIERNVESALEAVSPEATR